MNKLTKQYKNLDKEITQDLENIKKSYVSLGSKLMIAKRIYESDPVTAVILFTEDNFTHYCMSKDLNPKSADRIIRARNVHTRAIAAGIQEERVNRIKDYTKLAMINFAKDDTEIRYWFTKAEMYHRFELQQEINRSKRPGSNIEPDPPRLMDYRAAWKELKDFIDPKANRNETIHATVIKRKMEGLL